MKLKFSALRSHVTLLGCFPELVILLRWTDGYYYYSTMAVPDANWKMLCMLARMSKRDFKRSLDNMDHGNGD